MLFLTFVALSRLHIGAYVSKFNHFPVPTTVPISVIISRLELQPCRVEPVFSQPLKQGENICSLIFQQG